MIPPPIDARDTLSQREPGDPMLGRRGFLGGTGAAALLALAGCGGDKTSASSGDSEQAPDASAWTFTDDRGTTVRLAQRPKRVVAHVASAAALWDLGVQPVGVFGPLTTADGSAGQQAGDIDPSKVASVGEGYTEFNLDTFASLRPDLIVSGMYGADDTLWYLPKKIATKVRKLCPTIGIDCAGLSLTEPISRYIDLAGALGGDRHAPAVTKAKKRFEQASATVRTLANDRPSLRVLAVSGSPDYFYAVRFEPSASLNFLAGLGVNFPEVQKSAGQGMFFRALSWEQADKYPADVILYDSRPQAMPLEEMQKKPTFAKLPAVRAGQVMPWLFEARCTYEGWAPIVERLGTTLRDAKPLSEA